MYCYRIHRKKIKIHEKVCQVHFSQVLLRPHFKYRYLWVDGGWILIKGKEDILSVGIALEQYYEV